MFVITFGAEVLYQTLVRFLLSELDVVGAFGCNFVKLIFRKSYINFFFHLLIT